MLPCLYIIYLFFDLYYYYSSLIWSPAVEISGAMKMIIFGSPLGTLAARTEALMDYVAPLEELVLLLPL